MNSTMTAATAATTEQTTATTEQTEYTACTATYSPEDDKIRLYPSARLSKDEYLKVKAAGYGWAPKQGCFYAVWSPSREDLALEFTDEIEDEDKTLVERAEERAERFDSYRENRAADAERARAYVEQIAGGIPMGQPILVGHHSERHARRDAKRIETGMRRAVKMWETSDYWRSRAAGALQNAKYKELPAVRHRRIKGLESDIRVYRAKFTPCPKTRPEVYQGIESVWCPGAGGGRGGSWTRRDQLPAIEAHYSRWIQHAENRLEYERAMLGESGGLVAEKVELQVGGRVLVRGESAVILKVNKSAGQVVSVSVAGLRYSSIVSIENIQGYTAPTAEDVAKVKKATALPPMCNYAGEGFIEITQEKWDRIPKDYKGVKVVGEGDARHRVRTAIGAWVLPDRGGNDSNLRHSYPIVFIADAKEKRPPTQPAADGPVKSRRVRQSVRAEVLAAMAEPVTEGEGVTEGGISEVFCADRHCGENVAALGEFCPTHAGQAGEGVTEGGSLPEPVAEAAAPVVVAHVGRQVAGVALPPRPLQEPRQYIAPEPTVFDAMREALRTGQAVQSFSAPQLFPTPPALAARVVEAAAIGDDMLILEPSAGTGALIDALKEKRRHVSGITAIEVSPGLAEGLRRRFTIPVLAGDFLEQRPGQPGRHMPTFDRVVMNPPFADSQDIQHVRHAYQFLKPGGRLVAIMGEGAFFRQDRRAVEFRAWLDEVGGYSERLPAGSFEASGTGVSTRLVVVDREGGGG